MYDFNELLKEDGCAAVYISNFWLLAIEMFLNRKKAFKDITSKIIKKISQFRDEIPYKLRESSQFQFSPVHAAFNGTESIKFLGWASMKIHARWHKTTGESWGLGNLGKTMKQGKPIPYPYRLYQRHVCRTEFI